MSEAGIPVLQVSREPLEAHHLTGLPELAAAAFERACYAMPDLAGVGEDEEAASLDAMNAFRQAGEIAVVMRQVKSIVPTFAELTADLQAIA